MYDGPVVTGADRLEPAYACMGTPSIDVLKGHGRGVEFNPPEPLFLVFFFIIFVFAAREALRGLKAR